MDISRESQHLREQIREPIGFLVEGDSTGPHSGLQAFRPRLFVLGRNHGVQVQEDVSFVHLGLQEWPNGLLDGTGLNRVKLWFVAFLDGEHLVDDLKGIPTSTADIDNVHPSVKINSSHGDDRVVRPFFLGDSEVHSSVKRKPSGVFRFNEVITPVKGRGFVNRDVQILL